MPLKKRDVNPIPEIYFTELNKCLIKKTELRATISFHILFLSAIKKYCVWFKFSLQNTRKDQIPIFSITFRQDFV